MIRVLIVDDQVVVCEGLQAILSTVADIEVVGVANQGEEAVAMVEQWHPDVVLMDLKMPVMNGIQATREIRSRWPEVRVLVLTTYDFDEWVFDAIRNGAAGYLLKDTPRDQLIAAIRGTAAGKAYIDPAVAGKLLESVGQARPPSPDPSLVRLFSERELAVLRLLAIGRTNAEIASQLFLSEGTVRNYVSSIFTKLGVSERTQAAVIALRSGLADLNAS
ncbi:MAG TPA: DNA-binding response regulator [Anaerolinea thermolimosa]|uniref:DNA-binding response regulator n=1 Tax=Anaerolinea thermolimosa TaxID=229919 RepID=A0A3D1JFY3_9CHLR|nr:response regulator transcription factor [Anaerolinea thermolimosa]GAP08422.1 two component transcriptional regulator, LuxR family [Anaerolinea thermolimosa]HCE17364.1 DNA-binding response regulator [Anaerolinea thermolimosa]